VDEAGQVEWRELGEPVAREGEPAEPRTRGADRGRDGVEPPAFEFEARAQDRSLRASDRRSW
jgi:hypothetical protein